MPSCSLGLKSVLSYGQWHCPHDVFTETWWFLCVPGTKGGMNNNKNKINNNKKKTLALAMGQIVILNRCIIPEFHKCCIPETSLCFIFIEGFYFLRSCSSIRKMSTYFSTELEHDFQVGTFFRPEHCPCLAKQSSVVGRFEHQQEETFSGQSRQLLNITWTVSAQELRTLLSPALVATSRYIGQ